MMIMQAELMLAVILEERRLSMHSIVHYFADKNVRGLLLKPEMRQYDIEKSVVVQNT